MTSTDVRIPALRYEPLPAALAASATRSFVDEDGGVPLRCCLRDSRVGEHVALVAVAPEGPLGAYRETGPVFLHADGCSGPTAAGYPEEWRRRRQVFRAYDQAGRIIGGEVVRPGSGQEHAAARLLADADVAFLHTRNVVYGCYMLTIRREDGATA
jgi:hypothetical protein